MKILVAYLCLAVALWLIKLTVKAIKSRNKKYQTPAQMALDGKKILMERPAWMSKQCLFQLADLDR
jgi:hypothetical protein